ncbi:SDR family NAD(P)-dependent oxidoreductase [Frankia sp. R82]|uniref:SDR family NAD(P)-dependent oxidoreductase n=1 Tax=Frankia sp. R82 TaxID=2950553 RepID=UPI002042D4A4|nr:SDR family oxidoreductase [Frankia sp. R82]MCM3884755.1 SDR family oxidoreductase [Frankia sp. R82]
MGWFEERSGLAGTVAVVTGGAGGLGGGISTELAANGVRVALIDIDGDAVEQARADFDAAGHDAITVQGDARDPEALAALFAAVDERFGRMDTLVNVVGGTFQAAFEDTGPNAWNALIRTNLLHVLHACKLAVPRMRAGGRGGSIINITTIEAHRAAPGFAVYSAAKAGVEQFGRTLAVELGPELIRVNSIAPDYTPTPALARAANGQPTGMSDPVGTPVAIPMGRGGLINEVANAAVFLASGLSTYLTGNVLHVDGGTYASSGWFNWPHHGWANHVPPYLLDTLTAMQPSDPAARPR